MSYLILLLTNTPIVGSP